MISLFILVFWVILKYLKVINGQSRMHAGFVVSILTLYVLQASLFVTNFMQSHQLKIKLSFKELKKLKKRMQLLWLTMIQLLGVVTKMRFITMQKQKTTTKSSIKNNQKESMLTQMQKIRANQSTTEIFRYSERLADGVCVQCFLCINFNNSFIKIVSVLSMNYPNQIASRPNSRMKNDLRGLSKDDKSNLLKIKENQI